MFLFLNSTNQKFFTLALIDKKGEILIYKKINAPYQQSEKLITAIEGLLFEGKCKIEKIVGLIVVIGPGGFSALRIGLSVFNTLAWSLQIPIVGLESKHKGLNDLEIHDQIFKANDEKMIKIGFDKLKKLKIFKQVLPKYGSEPHINIKT